MKKTIVSRFEDELVDLIDRYMRDGLTADKVKLVLETRAGDNFNEGRQLPSHTSTKGD